MKFNSRSKLFLFYLILRFYNSVRHQGLTPERPKCVLHCGKMSTNKMPLNTKLYVCFKWQKMWIKWLHAKIHNIITIYIYYRTNYFNPNLPAPVNFVPFRTMTYSPFDINLMSMTCIKFVYLYFCLFLNKAYTFLFAMIYALSRNIIFLTFINVIDSTLTRNILKMGRVN